MALGPSTLTIFRRRRRVRLRGLAPGALSLGRPDLLDPADAVRSLTAPDQDRRVRRGREPRTSAAIRPRRRPAWPPAAPPARATPPLDRAAAGAAPNRVGTVPPPAARR